MTAVIYKYSLDIIDEQEVELTEWAQPLSVQFQNNRLCMWAKVNDSPLMQRIRVSIFGTGCPLPEDINYYTFLGTVQHGDGSLVWHVFWKYL